MTLRIPRIGPISGVLNAPTNIIIPPPPVPLCVFPNGMTTGGPDVPKSCTTIAPNMPILGDTGDTSAFGAISLTPLDPLFYGVAIGLNISSEGSGFVSYTPNANDGTLPAPYVTMNYLPNIGGSHSMGSCGYYGFGSSSPPTFTGPSYTASGGPPIQRNIVCALPTHTLVPLQFAFQVGSGSIANMPNPITNNSLLICICYGETSAVLLPGTMSLRYNVNMVAGVGTANIKIGSRCGMGGESQAVPVGSSSFSHWSFLSEWLIN